MLNFVQDRCHLVKTVQGLEKRRFLKLRFSSQSEKMANFTTCSRLPEVGCRGVDFGQLMASAAGQSFGNSIVRSAINAPRL